MARNRALLVGVSRNQACVDRKPFATDQPSPNTCLNNTLENLAEDVAVTKAFIAGARERRMIRDLVFDAQAAEPAVCHVDLNLTTQRPLRADGKHIADNQHSDYQHWIDGRPAQRRVVAPELRVDPREVKYTGDLAHAVIGRNHLIEAE